MHSFVVKSIKKLLFKLDPWSPPAALCFPRVSSSNTPRADLRTLFYCSSQTLALDCRLVMDYSIEVVGCVRRGSARPALRIGCSVRPRLSIALRHVPPPPHPTSPRAGAQSCQPTTLFYFSYNIFVFTERGKNVTKVVVSFVILLLWTLQPVLINLT